MTEKKLNKDVKNIPRKTRFAGVSGQILYTRIGFEVVLMGLG